MPEDTVLPTKDALVAAMNGTDVMEGWDVIVSYDQGFLNDHLQKAWTTSLDHGVHHIEATDLIENCTIGYNVDISRPALKFLAGGDKFEASLSFGLKGDIWERDSPDAERKKTTLSEGTYSISVIVPIVSVPDNVVDREEQKKKQKAKNEIVILDTLNSGETRLIKFHFDVPKENWKIVNLIEKDTTAVPSSPFDATAALNLHSKIVESFDKLNFCLAQVNNIKTSDATSMILRPESFLFACHGHGQKAVLSVYMKVTNGGGAEIKTDVKFLDAAKKMVPLPQGYKTSMIIRHSVIEKFFLNAMNNSLKTTTNPMPVSSSLQPNEDGFRFNVKLDTSFLVDARTGQAWTGTFDYWMEKINVAFQDHPIVLRIQKGTATWTLDYTTEGHEWNTSSYETVDISDGMSQEIESHRAGSIMLNFKVTKSSTLITQQSSLSATEVNFVDTDITITPSAVQNKPDGLPWNLFWDKGVLPDYRNFKMQFDKITIKFNAINFLLTQNIFGADKSPVTISINDGMMTPYDVLLLGNKI